MHIWPILALLYAGEPDAKVASSLAAMRASLEAQLAAVEFVGAGVDMRTVVDRFIQAVLDRKAEIEFEGRCARDRVH